MKNSIANIFTTNYALDEVEKKIGKMKNGFIIPHGIESELLIRKTNYDISNDVLNVVYVSPILDYKNHKYLISALNNLQTKRKICVSFIGGGDQKLINSLKRKSYNKKGNTFHFFEFLKREKVYQMTRDSDIAFFMSSVECFGITLLEYMRSGMPIICSSDSSLPETLADSGLLVNPKDIDGIIEQTTRLIESKNLRNSLGKKAYKRSLDYNWRITAIKTFKFLAESNNNFLNNLN